jgi:hypothetical protein
LCQCIPDDIAEGTSCATRTPARSSTSAHELDVSRKLDARAQLVRARAFVI